MVDGRLVVGEGAVSLGVPRVEPYGLEKRVQAVHVDLMVDPSDFPEQVIRQRGVFDWWDRAQEADEFINLHLLCCMCVSRGDRQVRPRERNIARARVKEREHKPLGRKLPPAAGGNVLGGDTEWGLDAR